MLTKIVSGSYLIKCIFIFYNLSSSVRVHNLKYLPKYFKKLNESLQAHSCYIYSYENDNTYSYVLYLPNIYFLLE